MCKDQNRNGPFRGTAINITKLAQACSFFLQIVRSTKNVMRAQLRIFFITVLRLNVYLRTRSLLPCVFQPQTQGLEGQAVVEREKEKGDKGMSNHLVTRSMCQIGKPITDEE